MTSIYPYRSPRSMQYPRRTLLRAERAVRCAPFLLPLFTVMIHQGVTLKAIAGVTGRQNGYTRRPLVELLAENELLWLIQTGVLRREVDGQGITDSFRLTPLGRQLLEQWQQQGLEQLPSPSWRDRVLNRLNRWVRLLRGLS